MGCGIACAAYLIGTNYTTTRTRHFKPSIVRVGDDVTRGYSRRALVAALQHAKFKVVEHRYRRAWALSRSEKFELIPTGSIVLIERWPGDRERHYVVRERRSWIDPLDSDESIPSRRGQVRNRLPAKWIPLGYLTCSR